MVTCDYFFSHSGSRIKEKLIQTWSGTEFLQDVIHNNFSEKCLVNFLIRLSLGSRKLIIHPADWQQTVRQESSDLKPAGHCILHQQLLFNHSLFQ